MSKSKTVPYLEALFAVIVWGASFIATRVAMVLMETRGRHYKPDNM